MKKGDVGVTKCFSKSTEIRDELSTTCNQSYVNMPVCLKNKQLKLIWFQW